MTSTFVYNIGCGRIFNVVNLADIGSNNQHPVSLILHKSCRWDKTIYGNCSPANFTQVIVHGLQIGDMLNA
ncbi:hypothetical protein D3C85_1053960 [compost metagenome]